MACCLFYSHNFRWVLLLNDRAAARLKMFDFLKGRFRGRDNNYWRRDMFTIPCPEEVFISTKLSRGFGRRLPCYNTDQCVIVLTQENTSGVDEIADQLEKNALKEQTHSRQSARHDDKIPSKQKLTLEELKQTSPPGYKRFAAALESLDVNDETALEL